MPDTPSTRRAVLKKAIYVAPVIVTLPVLPSFASAGSGAPEDEDKDKGQRKMN
jgi:hypothetical protein